MAQANWRYRRVLYLSLLASLRKALRDGLTVFWVSLSCGVGTDQTKLVDRHRELCRRVSERVGLAPSYQGVRTTEGNGVLHVIWIFPLRDGVKVYLPHPKELTALWSEVQPGALNSRFIPVGGRGDDGIRLARYIAGQSDYVRSFKSENFDRVVGA